MSNNPMLYTYPCAFLYGESVLQVICLFLLFTCQITFFFLADEEMRNVQQR